MEWLTDKEKRILLSALTREKEVCIRVDKELCREPYEETLESVCKSLENKFYYDRLFKQMERQIRADAIEDCIKTMQKMFEYTDNRGLLHYALYAWISLTSIRDALEQLKE